MSYKDLHIPRYTYNDYVNWEGRWELIEGHPVAMSPLPVPEHQRVAADIRYELTKAIRESKCRKCKAYDPLDYKISEETILQPDVFVVCEPIQKPYLDFAPSIVVEVLSPSTALRDRNFKFKVYQEQGVKYYLISDINTKIMEIYSLENGSYEKSIYAEPYEFTLTNDCNIRVDFSSIWNG